MRQEIRKAETCPTCHKITYGTEYSVTCDACGNALDEKLKNGERQYLNATIFPDDHSNNTRDLDFCDWTCLTRWFKQMVPLTFGFIKLPYVDPKNVVQFLAELKP